jgi:Co/Zn/Cd efflux system component
MEQANSLAEMMIYAMIGLAMSGVGAITLAHGRV